MSFSSHRLHYNINVSYLNVRLLQEILKTVELHASLSYIKALYKAAERDFEITILERRLLDSRMSILVSG